MTQWGLDTLFNPAKRHMDEEKRRLQATREQIGDSSGGKRIDLESGKVTIRRDDAEASETDLDTDLDADVAAEVGKEPAAPVEVVESPAQARARQRVAARKARSHG